MKHITLHIPSSGMNVDLRQMRYFVKVAETLNFSEASKDLCITQSTLSQQINQMERELGQKLFERNSHEVRLTEAGEEILPYVWRCLGAATECYERANDLSEMLTGSLSIGVTFSFSSIMTEAVQDFLKKYPHVKVNVCYQTMESLMEKLLHHQLDLVLAFKPEANNPKVSSEPIFSSSLNAVIDSAHPLAAKKKVTLNDLVHYPLAMPARGLQARNLFDQLTKGHNEPLNVKIEINNVQMLLRIIQDSHYVTILSASTVVSANGLKAIPIDIKGNKMTGCIHTLSNAYQKNAAREFIRMVKGSTSVMKIAQLKDLYGA